MRFLVDESADARLVSHLIALAHDANFIARSHRPGLDDVEILAIARAEGRILIVDDRDFGELVVRRQLTHAGVILFRLRTTHLALRIERPNCALQHHADRLDEFLVVTERAVRVRRMQPTVEPVSEP